MNKPINFQIAKLLKEKSFDLPTINWYHRETKKLNTNDLLFSMNNLTENYSAPTIAEVVMWLLEKHNIWFYVYFQHSIDGFFYELCDTKSKDNTVSIQEKEYKDNREQTFKTPNECYEVAIEYTLKNLI
jgi:hypothetical protein